MRREDLVESGRDPPLGRDHPYSVSRCNSSQSHCDGIARRPCDGFDDAFRQSASGYGVIGLARQ
jgi:hypothetical protein